MDSAERHFTSHHDQLALFFEDNVRRPVHQMVTKAVGNGGNTAK
jgi:hypothetical protein